VRLPEVQVMITSLRGHGWSYRHIAEAFGISKSSVGRLRRRETRKMSPKFVKIFERTPKLLAEYYVSHFLEVQPKPEFLEKSISGLERVSAWVFRELGAHRMGSFFEGFVVFEDISDLWNHLRPIVEDESP